MSGPMFVFDGEYRPKPQQNFGGRVETGRTLEALLERARTERIQREKNRLMVTSAQKIQAVVRGFLARKTVSAMFRNKFDESSNQIEAMTFEEHMEQIGYFIQFFNPRKAGMDGIMYAYLTDKLIADSYSILERCITDPTWAYRIRVFLRLGAQWYLTVNKSEERISGHHTFADTFLAFAKFRGNSPPMLIFFMRIWLDLLSSIDFINSWREDGEISCRRGYKDITRELASVVFILFQLLRDLRGELIFKVESVLVRGWKFRNGDPVVMTSRQFQHRVFESFTRNIILQSAIIKKADDFFQNILASEYLEEFPIDLWIVYVCEEFLPTASLSTQEARILMYNVLSVITVEVMLSHHLVFLSIVSRLIPHIDRQFASWTRRRATDDYESRSDTDDEDMNGYEDPKACKYLQENKAITQRLKEFFTVYPAIPWCITPNTRTAMDTIVGCLVRNNPKYCFIDFPFLHFVAYNRHILRIFYEMEVVSSGLDNLQELVTFSSLLMHLMQTLHDDEFLSVIPLTNDEMVHFINDLVTAYGRLFVNEKPNITQYMKKTASSIICKCLLSIYDRNTRILAFPEEIFLCSQIQLACPIENHGLTFEIFLHPDEALFTSPGDAKLCAALKEYPFSFPFHDRVTVWNRMINLEKAARWTDGSREVVEIRRSMIYEDTYEKLSLDNIVDIRNPIQIVLVNELGLPEAGVDGGGVFREFLTEASRAAVDPNRGFFRVDSQNRIYPNTIAKKLVHEYSKHYFLIGRLVGKALYEQVLLELPLAAFLIQKCIVGKIDSPVDYLATLDPSLHKQLLSLKTYGGDFSALGLDFTVTSNELGETTTVNLKNMGNSVAVNRANALEYIHLVSDYKINKEVEDECTYFRCGMRSVVPLLKIFSWREAQFLISGSEKPLDIEDWKNNTNYASGFTRDHPYINIFWEVLGTLDQVHLRKLLKFVTSCSRPPLLGFKDLIPNFGIQSAGTEDRLPTAATCINLLKLPEYEDARTLREKLIYAIEAQAGFELS